MTDGTPVLEEWQKHVKREDTGGAWCGAHLQPFDWCFTGVDHAALTVAQGQRLQPCPECAAAVVAIFGGVRTVSVKAKLKAVVLRVMDELRAAAKDSTGPDARDAATRVEGALRVLAALGLPGGVDQDTCAHVKVYSGEYFASNPRQWSWICSRCFAVEDHDTFEPAPETDLKLYASLMEKVDPVYAGQLRDLIKRKGLG